VVFKSEVRLLSLSTRQKEVKFCLENQTSYTWGENHDGLRVGDYNEFHRVQR